jgi:hypothetical protein
MELIQFVDVKIAGYEHSRPGQAKSFGFVAARDRIKPLRNYIYRRAIDNCEAVPVKRKTVIIFGSCFLGLQLSVCLLLLIIHKYLYM